MTTTTLSSKGRFKNLLKEMLKKNFSIAAYLAVILFLVFPMQMLLETNRQNKMMLNGGSTWQDLAGTSGLYTSFSIFVVAFTLMLGAMVVALMQCSYLHGKRAVDLYHSLPVTRFQLMSAGMVSSFLTVMVPFFINYIIDIAISAYRVSIMGGLDARGLPPLEILIDLLGWSVTVFGIMAVVYFVATQVGSVFENFVFSGELLVAPAVIIFLNSIIFENYLIGYVGEFNIKLFSTISPLGLMVGRIAGNGEFYYTGAILAWVLVSGAIFYGTLLMYRRRRSELAETSGCRGLLGVLFTLIAVYIAAPVISAMLFSSGSYNSVFYVLGVFIGAVLAFLLVEAVLNRGFAGLRRRLPIGAGICAVVVAFSVIVTTGGLGYEDRIPGADIVRSATITQRGWYSYVGQVDPDTIEERGGKETIRYYNYDDVSLTSPQAIEVVREIHRNAIDSQRRINTGEDSHYSSIRLSYITTMGDMNRKYYSIDSQTREALTRLFELPEYQQATNPLLRVSPETVRTITLYDELGFQVGAVSGSDRINELLAALRRDAERNGTRNFTAGDRVECYLALETILPHNIKNFSDADREKNYVEGFSLPVFADYSDTMAVLERQYPQTLVPSDLSEITGLAVERKYSEDYFVSNVDSNMFYYDMSSGYTGEYFVTQMDYIKAAAENQVNFSYMESNTWNYNNMIYCTFMKGSEQGVTVMMPIEKLPPQAQQDMPEIMHDYLAPGTYTAKAVMHTVVVV